MHNANLCLGGKEVIKAVALIYQSISACPLANWDGFNWAPINNLNKYS